MLLFAFAFALLSCCFPLPPLLLLLFLLLLVVVFIMYFALFASVLLLTLAIALPLLSFCALSSLPLSLSLAGFIFRQVLTGKKGQPRYAGIILDILRYSPVSPLVS